jgi:Lon protease-like protein
MIPTTLPLFPLPNVVLFPNVLLSLHIFEPRYRDMVRDALAGDRHIGIVLLRPGYEAEYDQRPPIYAVGCAGLITHSHQRADGRYDIVLRGLDKFRVDAEDHARSYRLATIRALPEPVDGDELALLRRERQRLEAILAATTEQLLGRPQFPPSLDDLDLVNALAQYLEFPAVERQALLECEGPIARCRALANLIEMRRHGPSGGWLGDMTH